MKKTTIATGRLAFGGGGLCIVSDEGEKLDLKSILPRFGHKDMHYDNETGWYQSERMRFRIEVDVKELGK